MKTKVCGRCSTEKLVTEFRRRGKIQNTWCTECAKAYDRDRYARKKPEMMEANRRNKVKLQAWFIALKKTLKCERCGFCDWRALQFHHHNNDKVRAVSEMVSRACSRETVLAEIAKCEVLCANCHSIEHVSAL